MQLKIRRSGFTLVELLIALAMGTIVSLGVASLISEMNQKTKIQHLQSVLILKADEIRQVMQNPAAFKLTVTNLASNPHMDCIRRQYACTDAATCATVQQCLPTFVRNSYSISADKIMLYKPDGTGTGSLFLNGLTSNTDGFTDAGAACTGFSNGAGNDLCPIGYTVSWYVTSTGTFSGNTVVMTAKLFYNPSDNNPLKNVINANANSPLGKYDVTVTYNIESLINLSSLSCLQDNITLANKSSYQFYSAQSVPTGSFCPAPETRTCNVINSNPILSGSAPYASCVQNCSGFWGVCSVPCGAAGVQTYTEVTPGNAWGDRSCPVGGTTQACDNGACPADVNCVGGWSACSVSCGPGGQQTYHITTAKQGTGTDCPFFEGAIQGCSPGACTANVDCAGTWTSCSANCGGGTSTFTVNQAQSGSGAACPSSPVACNLGPCAVDCVGSFGAWSACSAACGPGTQVHTYTVTTPPSNGGVLCPYANGQTVSQVCNLGACAVTTPGVCGTANKTTVATAPSGAAACASGNPSPVPSGAGPWSWTCLSVDGGPSSPLCSAAAACAVTNYSYDCGIGVIGCDSYIRDGFATLAACTADRSSCLANGAWGYLCKTKFTTRCRSYCN